MKLTRSTSYLVRFVHFLEEAVRAAMLVHDDADARVAFSRLRAMRAANARSCLREWRWHTAMAA